MPDELPRVLNLGCGRRHMPGAHNVDRSRRCQPDEQVDLEALPWPWPDDHFYVVHAYQILEHVEPRHEIIQEIWRVCANGALVSLSVPRHDSDGYVQHTLHKSKYNEGCFGYYAMDVQYNAWLGEYAEDRFTHARFKLLRYWLEPKPRTLYWGERVFKDELWFLMVAIKPQV